MMIIYGLVEVWESEEGFSHGAQAWEMRGQMVVPHTPWTLKRRIDFLSWFSPTGSSDEEWDFV